jgi:DNA-binding HxlR family transcriptional regulator
MSVKGDVFNSKCLSRLVLDLLAEKWVLLIIHSLSQSESERLNSGVISTVFQRKC